MIITGYTQEGRCEHCNRPLKHVIKTDRGEFGATCIDKKLTKPRIQNGKSYRVGSEHIVFLAKAQEFWSVAKQVANGLYLSHFTFDDA
jgi:hypothetical protein